jgi:hypothetical protein
VLLLVYIFPYIYLNQDAYLTIHDNLDSDFHYFLLLKNSGNALNFDLSATIPQVMNGLPRCALRSGINLEVWSFLWFEPYTAFLINFIVIHLLGFVGMFLFLKRYVITDKSQLFITISIAICFAFVPTYMVHGISVHGQPLLLFSFLNIKERRQQWFDWLIIILFPLYSFLIWSGLFIWVALFVYWSFLTIKYKKLDYKFLIGLLFLGLGYVLTEFQMIYAFFAKVFVSHRTEYDYALLMPMNFKAALNASFRVFIQTYYHSGGFLTIFIFLVGFISLLKSYLKKKKESFKIHSFFLISIIGICLFHGFYRFFTGGAGTISKLAEAFQFDRFYFLLPFIWLWWLAIIVRENSQFKISIIALQFILMLYANTEWLVNVKQMAGIETKIKHPSYRAFYAEKQFDEIKKTLSLPQQDYRIICIGFHPAVAQHNGFYTLDAFQNNYLLSYKHQFREIIADELIKNEANRKYFDGWGTRCYTFVADLPLNFMRSKFIKNKPLSNLSFNIEKLKAMKGQFIFSTNPIDCTNLNLTFVKKFESNESYWNIFVYKTI